MNSNLLTDAQLRLVNPQDRAKLGKVQTAEEAQDKYIVRNERELQKHIANLLRLRGIWFDVSAMHKKTTNIVGRPDFLFCHDDRACALEVKFEGGKVSEEQRATMEKMKSNGWRVAVVRSLDEVRQFLDKTTL